MSKSAKYLVDRRTRVKRIEKSIRHAVYKVRSTDAIAASVSNFGDESAEIHRLTFLTESLILAQNERWRRG
jgi:hypothetical protein